MRVGNEQSLALALALTLALALALAFALAPALALVHRTSRCALAHRHTHIQCYPTGSRHPRDKDCRHTDWCHHHTQMAPNAT